MKKLQEETEMKAILILDNMPHNMCRQCELFQSITIFHGVTYWCGGKSLIIDNPNVIQDFCPLKPMPQKKTIDITKWNDYGSGWDIGYNACLDEILGEEE